VPIECWEFAVAVTFAVLSAIIGIIFASPFSAVLVYAQKLVPGKVGTMSGLFFGPSSVSGGLGSALLGALADRQRPSLRLPHLLLSAHERPPHRAPAKPWRRTQSRFDGAAIIQVAALQAAAF
jgi:hypothetical protein